ncbi:MAG: hypothetical protein H0W25_13735 [Acidimicrobiia bacterium]|nr:hypothetical protein [Acidimicrobiia bacterium]
MAGIALGVLATTRAAFGHVPALVALALWPRGRRAALAVGLAGTAVVLALHGALIARVGWSEYTPVQQLLVKSDEDLSDVGRLVVVAGVVLAGVLVAVQLRRRDAMRPAPILLAGVGVPMVAIALAGLVTARDPSSWSAGSYFIDTGVIAAVWAAERVAIDSPE